MKANILILEESDRLKEISKILGEKEMPFSEWNGESIPNEPELILAHHTDFGSSTEEALLRAADSGSVSVCYSEGHVGFDSRTRKNDGWFHVMNWRELREVLWRLPPAFPLDAFGRAVESVRKRDLLNAIAILSKCASVDPAPFGVKTVQVRWRSQPKKWRDALEEFNSSDLRIASGIGDTSQYPGVLSEVEILSTWLWPEKGTTNPPPDFVRLLEQLHATFGMRV